jgi:F-type H+-transporting ATPase subunit delta
MPSNKKARREAKRLFHVSLSDGSLDENRMQQAVQSVAQSGRRDRLAILAHLLRLVRLHAAQHTAEIESATPLPPNLQTELETTLTRRYGRGLTTRFKVSPPLIGGVRIQVGSDVYDDSVRAGLAALEKRF